MKKILFIFITVSIFVFSFGLSAQKEELVILEEKVDAPEIKIHTEDSIRYIPNKEDVKIVAKKYAQKYKINEDAFICTLMKESGLDSKRVDGSYKCGDSGASCGLSQFQCPTWRSVRKHMGKDGDCTLRHDDFENLETTAYGMANGWKWHWTGYIICNRLGYNI